MSSTREVRVYKLLGLLAVVHSAIVFALYWLLMAMNYVSPPWYHYVERLFAGLSTVWFFWPIILALHIGSSKRSAYTALGLATAVFFLPALYYFRISGAALFAGEDMLCLSPYVLGDYGIAYVRGWEDARRDVRADRLILESYGFGVFTPGAPALSDAVRQQHRIEINQVANCGVNTYILGHARGYNRVAVREIERRFGPELIAQAERDAAARQQRHDDMSNAGKAEAENDIRAGRLVLRLYRSAIEGENDYRNFLRESYQLDLQRVSQAPLPYDADTSVRSDAYNMVMFNEIRRRFGEETGLAEVCVTSGQSYASFLQSLERDRERNSKATH
ncbi:MAG: hypothetical protein M3Y03_01275 [Verrucomicrobiota bacterium]|nr:hypothetical protein [Verrucomicrobiota bacterium]